MNDVVSKIENYFRGTLKYPLIVVVSPDTYKEILNSFSNTEKILVSKYCLGPDKDPDLDKLREDIKQLSGKYLLLGLGEFLASKKGMKQRTISSYKDINLQADGRVVVVLSIHMFAEVKKLYESDPRIRSRIILPLNTPVITEEVKNGYVYGIKAYLEACENAQEVGSVKSARNIGTVVVINPENAFSELEYRFPNEMAKLTKEAGTPEQWGELLENINKENKNILQYLAMQRFEALDYKFLEYAKKNDYTSWLYFLNLKFNTDSQSYLGWVASNSLTLGRLFEVSKKYILDMNVSDKNFRQFYNQRKIMLRACTDADMADYIALIDIHGEDRIAYLTDNTKIEKKKVVEALAKGAKDKYLSENYHDLYLYLSDYIFEDERLTEYFSLYKKYKIKNKVDKSFLDIVNEYAISRPYNSFPARSSMLTGEDDGETILFFLDALGVEYLGYIKGKCSELKLDFDAKIARAELPTTTENNKIFYEEWLGEKEVPIKDLDELKHKPERGYDYNNSIYPIHLVEELEVINGALERIKERLSTESSRYRRVLIVSDHGASRLAVISSENKISNNNCDSKSSGRYCVGEDLPTADNIIREEEGLYAVIADYSRFTGSRAASVEIHGGATLEEILVPIIEISLPDGDVEVLLENDNIEAGYNIIPTLIFIIRPDRKKIRAKVNSNFYQVEKIDNNKYKVEMKELKKGNYILEIFDNQNRIATKEFTIKSKGMSERNLF